MESTKLLVVVDNSLASRRAVAYVGQILGGRRGFQVCLAHTLPSAPADVTEFGGAEDPKKEEWPEALLRASRHLWVAAKKRKLSASLELGFMDLRRAGFARGDIEVQ